MTRTASDEPAAVAGTIVVELKEGKNVACIDVFCDFVRVCSEIERDLVNDFLRKTEWGYKGEGNAEEEGKEEV